MRFDLNLKYIGKLLSKRSNSNTLPCRTFAVKLISSKKFLDKFND